VVRPHIRLALAPLFAAAALAFFLCAPARADAPLPPGFFGVNLNRVMFDDPDPSHTAPLQAARAAGISHGRIDLPWDAVQPGGPSSVDYAWTDRAMASLAAQSIEPTPMLGYSARWAATTRGNDKTPPSNLGDYVQFAKLMVGRYGPGGSFWQQRPDLPYLPVRRWEVWNEPNLPHAFWQSGRDPGQYARMYLATRAAIKAIDPGAQVIVGGLYSSDIAFVTDMYRLHPELHGNVDGLGIHPYAPTVHGVVNAIRGFRAALDAEGETSVQMDVTEVGWQRQGHTDLTLDEPRRAAYMAAITDILARSDCGIDAVEPYAWETAERNPDDGEDWYGMWSPSQGLLPTGQAYASAVARYSDPAARAAARSSGLLHICHPPKLHVRLKPAGAVLGIEVRAGGRSSKGAHLTVRLAVRGGPARLAHRVRHVRGRSYFPLPRSVTRVAVKVTAHGFSPYSAAFIVVRHRRRFRLKPVKGPRRHHHPERPGAVAPAPAPTPPDQPTNPQPPHSDDPPCLAPGVPSALGTPVAALPTNSPCVRPVGA
jgi:hypothetical protein